MPDDRRLQRIEELYYEAVDWPVDERSALLRRACAEDTGLLQEVESLLAVRSEANLFFQAPERTLAAATSPPEDGVLGGGERLQHYRIIRLLGKGGMGEVFLAEDTRLHRQVALKLLPPQFSQQPGRVRRFEQEARVTTALNHPNIVTLYDTGQHDGSYFIVNEFVDGQTLRAYLNERGVLPVREALDIAQQIATALAAAHAAGIVHRDIKPENVMLRRDGFVKVLDFGLAKLASPLPDLPSEQEDTHDEENPHAASLAVGRHPQSQTAAGALLGTIRYMSPEQARGLPVDARTDVFSLGVVLYEMLAGYTPFQRATAGETLTAILDAEPTALPELVPVALRQFVTRALHKAREHRWQTAAECATALRELAEATQFSARLAETSGWRSWLRRWQVLALGGVAVLALALAGYWGRQPRGSFESEVLPNLRPKPVDEWKLDQEAGQFGIRLSPDDKQLAFNKYLDGSIDVFVEPAVGGEQVRLTQGASSHTDPIWSPDGKWIIYLSARGGQRALWQVPSNGGASQWVATLPDAFSAANVKVYLLCWSQDGQRVYFLMKCDVYALELATKQIRKLTTFLTPKCSNDYVDLSADEQWIAYHQTTDGIEQLWALKLNGGTPIQITHEGEANTYPIWHIDGQRLIYTSTRNGVSQICAAYLDGRTPIQITFSHENLSLHDISRDGRRLLYTTSNNEADLFRYDLSTGEETRVTAKRRLELSPTVAPDGQRFAYQHADVSGGLQAGTLWLQPAGRGALPVRLAEDMFDPRWSPQAEQLAFLRRAGRRWSLWTVKTDGSEPQPLVNEDVVPGGYMPFPFRWAVYPNYSWSPDGSRLAYLSDKSGSRNVWTISSTGADAQMLSANSNPKMTVAAPLFAPDNRGLAFLTIDRSVRPFQNQICVAEGAPPRVVFLLRGRASLLGWFAAGAELLIAVDESVNSQQTGEVKLLRLSVATGVATEITRLPAAYINSFRLAPTHDQVAYVTRQQERDELWRLTLPDGKTKRIHTNDDPLIYFAELAWTPDARALYVSKQSNSIALVMIENFR